ncbi:hypothetical protein [Paenibacillus sp. FSL K6-2859]
MTKMTNEGIREFNLWLYDNPRYHTLSWREQVAEFYAQKYRKVA